MSIMVEMQKVVKVKCLIFWIPKRRNYSDQFALYSQIHCQINSSRQISREEQ
jgi:hypothetical protein